MFSHYEVILVLGIQLIVNGINLLMEQKQYELAAQVLREVQKVILGKREIVEKVLMAVLAQGHVLLDDVPGRRTAQAAAAD